MAPHANGIIAPSSDSPRVVLAGKTGRILCVADIRGDYHELNRLIREHEATAVIHTGDFGFMTADSLERMGDKILRHLVQYSPLISPMTRAQLLEIPENGRAKLIDGLTQSSVHFPLSQFPLLLTGAITFPVPVFTVWGLIEDVRVLEKFRTGEYEVRNLSVVDEATSRVLDVGGVHLRLFGLGGAIAPHKLFDNGEGLATIAGGQGTMWTTALQIGELIDTASRVHNPTETRLLIASAPISRNGLLYQLAVALRADLTISGGIHFRYPASYNESSMHEEFSSYRHKLETARDNFQSVYSKVKDSLDRSLTESQKGLVKRTLSMTDYVPAGQESDDGHSTNIWHWVLSDASSGHLLFSISEGRVSAETKSSGLNFAHRAASQPAPPNAPIQPKREEPKPQPRPAVVAVPPPAPQQPVGQVHPQAHHPQAQHPHQHSQGQGPIGQMGPMNIRGIAKRPPPSGPLPAKPAPQGPTPTGSQQQQQQQPPIAAPVPTPAQNRNAGPIRAPRGPSAAPAPTPAKDAAQLPKSSSGTPVNANPNASGRPERGPRPARNGKSPGNDLTPSATPAAAGAAGAAGAPGAKPDTGSNTPAAPAKELKARPEPRAEKAPKVNGEEEAAETKRANSLFVKGIPTPTTEEDLKGLFENASKITNIKIIMDHMTKKQKDFAYVDFASEEDANEAVKNNKGSIRDTPLNISISNPTVRRGEFSGRGGPRTRGSFRGRGRGGFGGAGGDKAGGDSGSASPAPSPAAAPAAAAAAPASGEKK